MLPLLCRAASFRPLVRLAGVLTLFAAGLSAMLWPLADELVRLVYGPAYSDAVPAFRVLLAAFPLMSLNYALTHQLIGWDGHRAFAALCGAALVVNIGLNVRLIPAFGIVGAAWTTLWTEVVLTLGCLTALGLLPSRASAAAAVARVAS
jgi:O-antigen/teichoic acid export membrane protein